jgi:protein subunit release factor A
MAAVGLEGRLAGLEVEFDAVEAELAEPATSSDPGRLRELSQRHKELSEVVATWRQLG